MEMYNASFKSKETARAYNTHLNKYASPNNLSQLLGMTQREAEDKLIHFIITNKETKSWAALHNYVAAVAKFYLINDVPLNLNRVKRFMPEHTKLRKDRGYRDDEILKVLELANERTRALVLLLASSGMRIGAIPLLRVGHLEDKGDIYKITVYENTNSEYFTFCTPECKRAIQSYFEIRKRHGEIINDKSPVIREQYDKRSEFSARHPKPTTKAATTHLLGEVLECAGLRATPQEHEVKLAHGFRKFFNTQLVSTRINPLVKELLMGHLHVGLEDSYYRPQEEDIQIEYEKGIDALTIDPANRLRKKVEKLEVEKTQIEALALELEKVKKAIGQ
jgi:integrase